MNLVFVLIALVVISFLWALWSLKEQGSSKKHVRGVKKELSLGRVIFHRDLSSQDSVSESSSGASSDSRELKEE